MDEKLIDEDIEILDDRIVIADIDIQEVTLPSLTYRVVDNRIIGKIDDIGAIKQAIDKILQTDRFIWEIYTDQYGNDLSELVGEELPLVEAELERIISESLTGDDRVDDVIVDNIIQTQKNTLLVHVLINTMFGDVIAESEVII